MSMCECEREEASRCMCVSVRENKPIDVYVCECEREQANRCLCVSVREKKPADVCV